MGVFSNLKQKLSRKKLEPLPPLPSLPTKPEVSFEPTNLENIKAKVELSLTQLDSLRIQYETLNERIKNIERLVTEIRSYCK